MANSTAVSGPGPFVLERDSALVATLSFEVFSASMRSPPSSGAKVSDVDQADDVVCAGGGAGDHHTAVGVPDTEHRPGNLSEQAGGIRGIDGDAPKGIGGGSCS